MSKKEFETKKPSRTLSSKVANMENAANDNDLAVMFATKMEKQREHFKEDMASLIIANFHEMVDTLGRRGAAAETTAGDNFNALFKAEKAINDLQTLNATLVTVGST